MSSLFAIFLQSRLGTPGLWYRPRRTGSGDQARFTDRQRHITAVSKAYGRKSADRTKPEFDVIFLVTYETLFGRLRVVLWQKLKQFLKIYEWQSVYIPLFGPLLHQWPV